MENLDQFIPLVLLVIWGISQLFTKGDKEEEQGTSEEDALAQQRREEIREEMRRRRAESRQEEAGQAAPVRPAPAQPAQREQVRPQQQPAQRPVQRPTQQPRPFRQPQPTAQMQTDHYAQQIQQLEAQAREANNAAERAFREAQRRIQSAQKVTPTLPMDAAVSGNAIKDALATLRDPQAARKAIILREVLGGPVSTRDKDIGHQPVA